MKISDFLSNAEVFAELAAADKNALLRDLGAKAASSIPMPVDVVTAGLLKRESLGSTGIGAGIAIPHARFADLNQPFGLFARLKRPIEFDAIDRRKVDLVFVLLLPQANESDQMTPLALVARRLREPRTVEQLRNSRDINEIYRVLSG